MEVVYAEYKPSTYGSFQLTSTAFQLLQQSFKDNNLEMRKNAGINNPCERHHPLLIKLVKESKVNISANSCKIVIKTIPIEYKDVYRVENPYGVGENIVYSPGDKFYYDMNRLDVNNMNPQDALKLLKKYKILIHEYKTQNKIEKTD